MVLSKLNRAHLAELQENVEWYRWRYTIEGARHLLYRARVWQEAVHTYLKAT